MMVQHWESGVDEGEDEAEEEDDADVPGRAVEEEFSMTFEDTDYQMAEQQVISDDEEEEEGTHYEGGE